MARLSSRATYSIDLWRSTRTRDLRECRDETKIRSIFRKPTRTDCPFMSARSRHQRMSAQCPLYPRKRTSIEALFIRVMSGGCRQRAARPIACRVFHSYSSTASENPKYFADAVNDIGCDPSRQRSVVLIIVVVIIIVAPVSSSSDASIVAIVGFCLINRNHDA